VLQWVVEFSGVQRKEATIRARIRAGGVEKEVGLVETAEASGAVDAAYHAKYGPRYPTIVPSIVSPEARDATLKLVPR
jgi:hypothetical protein